MRLTCDKYIIFYFMLGFILLGGNLCWAFNIPSQQEIEGAILRPMATILDIKGQIDPSKVIDGKLYFFKDAYYL